MSKTKIWRRSAEIVSAWITDWIPRLSAVALASIVSACGGSAGTASDGATASSAVTAPTATDTTTAGPSATGTITRPTTTGTTSAPTTGSSSTTDSSASASPDVKVTEPLSTSNTTSNSTTAPTLTKSVKQWTVCDGKADDSVGAAKAVTAARHGAFALVIDCTLRLHIGSDVTRPIFIDDGTTIQFSSGGKIVVDNVLIPAFVIAGSHNVTLTDWDVEYVGGLPVDYRVGGYTQNGTFISRTAGYAQPTMAFNDGTMTDWLTAHRAIRFDRSRGAVSSVWVGPTNTSALFFITGDAATLQFSGMKLAVPATAGGNRFIPVAFSLSRNFKAGQTVTASTPITAQYMALPHDIAFTNIELDGTYMGWVGGAQNLTIKNVQSHRYGDLQDANGAHVGGVGKWFAPPHLFYLSYNEYGDPALFNKNIQINSVVDDGPRIGEARDQGGTDTISGYAASLKIGCRSCAVSNYYSYRPDGFLDLLVSSDLTITNAVAVYDSSFVNNLYPGWRFPSALSSTNVLVQSVSLTDEAAGTYQLPIGNAGQLANKNIALKNVNVVLNRWMGVGSVLPTVRGTGNELSMGYRFQSNHSRLLYSVKGDVRMTLQALPDTLSMVQSTVLTWASSNASACTASGAWSGAFATRGSVVYKPTAVGSPSFTLDCHAGTVAAVGALPLQVSR